MVGGECHSHHSVVREVEEAEKHDEHIPEELGRSPLKIDHRVSDEGVHQGLDQTIWQLNQHLPTIEFLLKCFKQTPEVFLRRKRSQIPALLGGGIGTSYVNLWRSGMGVKKGAE